jgi:hypothetical protein
VFAGIFVTVAAIMPSAMLSSRVASASSPDVPEEQKTVQIVLYSAAEPQPALKYQLLPPFLERRPGNAAVWWNRIQAERSGFFNAFYADNGPWSRIEKWMEMPIGDPREKAYREKAGFDDLAMIRGGQLFADIQRAAQYESCDWEQPIREANFAAILLPEIQQTRSYARLLMAKAHLEIAEGRYDEAVRTLQCGYAEGRQVAQSPFIVSELVGVTIAGIMSYQVQQFIQRPDAPNLYWALSTLPRPIVDSRLCGEAESNVLYLQFPELRDLDKKQLAPEEWRGLLLKVMRLAVEYDWFFNPTGLKKHVAPAMTTLAALQGYPQAKQYLINRGRSAAEVEAMPVAQVILLYTVHVYDELRDEQFKWFFLPPAEGRHGLRRAESDLGKKAHAKEIIPIASLVLPAVASAKEAETRDEWNVAVMRVFEAMRLYAAAHDGRWPERLGDITEVPIPVNPVDGKPFIYERQGDKAILTCEEGTKNWHKRFEITLMPKAK